MVMLGLFVIAFAVVAVFVVVAALSDRRDRRAGFDPKVRTESVTQHRRELKEQLYRNRAKRLGWSDPDEDPRHRSR
jgi:hypothetical protein